mgnify:CR=1 FL=1|jgi:hypothetical protein
MSLIGSYFFSVNLPTKSPGNTYLDLTKDCKSRKYNLKRDTYSLHNIMNQIMMEKKNDEIGNIFKKWIKLPCDIAKEVDTITFLNTEGGDEILPFEMSNFKKKGQFRHDLSGGVYDPFKNKLEVYKILQDGDYHSSYIPKYYDLGTFNLKNDKGTNEDMLDEFCQWILEKTQKLDLKKYSGWLIKRVQSSLGGGIYSFYNYGDDKINCQHIKNQIKYTSHGSTLKKEINKYLIGGSFILSEFVNSINLFPSNKLKLYPDDDFLVNLIDKKNKPAKMRAYFITVDYNNGSNKYTYGWICPYLDIELFKKSSLPLEETLSKPENYISNEGATSLVDGTNKNFEKYYKVLKDMMNMDGDITIEPKDTLYELLDGKGENIKISRYDYVFLQLNRICTDILNKFKLGSCTLKVNPLVNKCYHLYALDVIINDEGIVKFLEVNTVPYMNNEFYKPIADNFYDVFFEHKLADTKNKPYICYKTKYLKDGQIINVKKDEIQSKPNINTYVGLHNYSPNILKKLYDSHELTNEDLINMWRNNYISDETYKFIISKINLLERQNSEKKIKSLLGGGSKYFQKYCKYKSKYINLKKKN